MAVNDPAESSFAGVTAQLKVFGQMEWPVLLILATWPGTAS